MYDAGYQILLARYLSELKKKSGIIDLINRNLYACQQKFIHSTSLLKALLTPRQVGKTLSVIDYMILVGLLNTIPTSTILYCCNTQRHAKKIVWFRLLNRLDELGVVYRANNAELSVTFENKTRLELYGLDDEKKAKDVRGLQPCLVVIDEAQEIRSDHLSRVIRENLSAGLKTYKGTLVLAGTPGPIPDGFFYEASIGKNGFSSFRWTQYDNIHYPEWKHITNKVERDAYISQWLHKVAMEEYGGWDVPAFRREYLGEWCQDLDAYCYHLSDEKNLITDEQLIKAKDMRCIIGVDLGSIDETAIVVLAYDRKAGLCYLVHEFSKPDMLIDEVIFELRFLLEKYKVDRIRMDSGGMGAMITKQIAKEIAYRYRGVPIIGAEKSQKAAFMLLMDNAFRTAKIKLQKDQTWFDCVNLVKDNDSQIEAKGQKCDRPDALLYAWRDALYFSPEEEEKTKRRSNDPFSSLDEYYGLEG